MDSTNETKVTKTIGDFEVESDSPDTIVKYIGDKEALSLNSHASVIRGGAFEGNKTLKRIALGGVFSVDKHAFKDCENLEEVIINIGATISTEAFLNCKKLKTVLMRFKSDRLGDAVFMPDAFKGCDNLFDENGMIITEDNLIGYDHRSDVLKIPDGVTEVSISFKDDEQIREVYFPDSVTIITNRDISYEGDDDIEFESPFNNCPALTKVVFPSNAKKIPKRMFVNCPNLTEFNIPGSVETICEKAFDEAGLKKIYIGKNCKNLEDRAFYNCSNLKEFISDADYECITMESISYDNSHYRHVPPVILESFEFNGTFEQMVDPHHMTKYFSIAKLANGEDTHVRAVPDMYEYLPIEYIMAIKKSVENGDPIDPYNAEWNKVFAGPKWLRLQRIEEKKKHLKEREEKAKQQ